MRRHNLAGELLLPRQKDCLPARRCWEITTQDIRKRLRYGFSATGKHGYYGYKWKDQNTPELLIWSFPGSTREHVETIEAELVYFIREITGKWPKYQMEIHFHGASEKQRQIAESILSQCLNQ